MINQKKLGVITSYITLVVTSLAGVVFTPLLICSLGIAEYGLYQLINSFAGYLVILNFGTGTVVTIYVSKYRDQNNKNGQENFLAMGLIITFFLFFMVLIVGSLLLFGIRPMFSNTLTLPEIIKAKVLFILMVLNIAFSFIVNYFDGIISGYAQFGITNGFKLFRTIIKYIILWVLLKFGYKSLALVSLDLSITILILLMEIIYCFRYLEIKIKLHKFDKQLLRLIGTFSFAIFLQAIVNQINQNIDRVILGAKTDTSTVAIYSIALVVFTMFNNITGIVGSVFIPDATKMISNGSSSKELTDLVIKPGRIQFMIGGAIVMGFAILGERFIKIWVGNDFMGAYIATLLLIVPSLFPMVQNVANTVLDAMMKRVGRSIILVFMAVLNVMLTILFVDYFGYIGAAVSTAISIIVGNIILMNIYYKTIFGLQVFRMFKEIFRGTLPSLIITSIPTFLISRILTENLLNFILIGIFFVILYITMLYRYSLNMYEKKLIIGRGMRT